MSVTLAFSIDLKLSNIMLSVDDPNVLSDFEKESGLLPSEQKVMNKGRAIYSSRPLRPPHANAYGSPVLCDFGEARIGASHQYAEIQPEIYKALEILMQFDWGHSVDIWNVACLVSDDFVPSLSISGLSCVRCGKC